MHRRVWLNLGVTVVLLLAATFSSLVLGGLIGGTANAQMLFLLAVLLIARFTDGYLWGVGASIVSVPLVNYMFTYPYFSFNLTISGYLLTFLTMLAVSLIVSVLTARIKQQEQIRLDAEREKLRANLLRAVSHDLRTPLTSIVGATGAILDNALPPEKQRELLADVNADAQWLLRMIENQLTITRIQGETAPLHTETEVVEDVLAEAAIKFQKHFPDIKVDMDLCDDILLADMDAVLIEQVVLNMLENAVYHGKHTTRIRLSAERSGRFVLVTVSDDGAGIPRDGSPVCSRPCRKAGGVRMPKSTWASGFRFVLVSSGPTAAKCPPRTMNRAARAFPSRCRKRRTNMPVKLLVVEDEKSILKLLRTILTANKYEVVEASTRRGGAVPDHLPLPGPDPFGPGPAGHGWQHLAQLRAQVDLHAGYRAVGPHP